MKKDFVKAPHWSIEKWTSVLAKRWRTKEKVSTLLESEVQSILHCKTMYCYQKVVPSMFITSENDGPQAVFFTVVDPMDDEQGSKETLCDLSQARIAPETISNYSILVQFEAKRTAI